VKNWPKDSAFFQIGGGSIKASGKILSQIELGALLQLATFLQYLKPTSIIVPYQQSSSP